MLIGVPKEIKDNEYRVAVTPAGVRALVECHHKVVVEKSAGEGSNFGDEEYASEGASIVSSAQDVFNRADMIYKVKEPIPSEYPLLKRDQILFTYLHLAAAKVKSPIDP